MSRWRVALACLLVYGCRFPDYSISETNRCAEKGAGGECGGLSGDAGAMVGGGTAGAPNGSGAGGVGGMGGLGGIIKNPCDRPVPELCSCVEHAAKAYLFCAPEVTWGKARFECLQADAQLVRIDNRTENDFLTETAMDLGWRLFWAGGSDGALEGQWTWVDGTVFFELTANGGGGGSGGAQGFALPWEEGEPDGSSHREDCLRVSIVGSWEDALCEEAEHSVCEVD